MPDKKDKKGKSKASSKPAKSPKSAAKPATKSAAKKPAQSAPKSAARTTKTKKSEAAPVSKPPAPHKLAAPAVTHDEIALRAYYIGERRQMMGWPGDSSGDWVEAEAQLVAEKKRRKA